MQKKAQSKSNILQVSQNVKLNQKAKKGVLNELKVAEFFQAKGFCLLQHNLQTPYAQIDLLMRDQRGGLCVIEVKSILSKEYLSHAISRRQKNRLRRASLWFIEQGQPCRLLLATVFENCEISIFAE